jgi:hypothetical protein
MVSTSTVYDEQKQLLAIISFQAGLNFSKKDVGCLRVAYFACNQTAYSLKEVFAC